MQLNFERAAIRDTETELDHLYIWPQRSLDDNGRRILLGSVALAFSAVAFWAIRSGVWPMLIYIGLALGGFAWALTANTRKAHFAEHVELLPDRIRVSRIGPAAREASAAEFNPHWLRIVDVPGPWGEKRLALRESGRRMFIGDFLTQEERDALAVELRVRIARRYRK